MRSSRRWTQPRVDAKISERGDAESDVKALVVIAMAIGAVCGPASAQVSVGDQADPRFDLSALLGICDDVRARSSQSETKVETAAGVQPGDSQELMQSKVQTLFRDHMPRCNGFNVSRGNILKYAVAFRTYDFLYTAANTWQVDLNVADANDRRNVLDYVENELLKNRGMPAEADLLSYRDMLVRAGARTTAQLEAGEDCRPSTRCRR